MADLGKDDAGQARRLLAATNLHGHKYAIDAMLAVGGNPRGSDAYGLRQMSRRLPRAMTDPISRPPSTV